MLRTIAAVLVVCAAQWLGSDGAQAGSVLGLAGSYNEFILGDSTRSNVDAQGRVAVGGNAYFNNFTVASQMPTGSGVNLVVGGTLTAHGATVRGSIVTGGNATYTQPTVFGDFSSNGNLTLGSWGMVQGDIRYGGAYTPSTSTVLGSAVGPVSTPMPIDFAAEGAFLRDLSDAQYNASDPTGLFQYSALTFTGGDGLNVFQTTGAELQAAVSGINILAPAGSTVVINVLGSGFTVPNTGFNFSGGIGVDRVLFNFVDATAFTIQGSAHGTFLAPRAAITTSYGGFNGNLIAASLTGSIETHTRNYGHGADTYFTGDLRPLAVVPEPSSIVLAGLGGLGLGIMTWRRRRRAS